MDTSFGPAFGLPCQERKDGVAPHCDKSRQKIYRLDLLLPVSTCMQSSYKSMHMRFLHGDYVTLHESSYSGELLNYIGSGVQYTAVNAYHYFSHKINI